MIQEKGIKLPSWYRMLAFIFFMLTLVLAFGVFYYSSGKVSITITPAYQKVSTDAVFEVQSQKIAEETQDTTVVSGNMYEFPVRENITVPSTGSTLVLDDTVGSVILINNYSQDQVLVAATRLLSSEGILLRLKDRARIPKGGTTTARVYPDKPLDFTELQPSRLTIPGLSRDLQEKIYAENKVTLKAGGTKITVVSEQDLISLEKKILEALDESAQKLLQEKITDEALLYSKLIQKEIVQKNIEGAPGDEKDDVSASVEAKITAVVFDELRVLNMMKQRLSSTLSSGKELKDIEPKSLTYSIDRYDMITGTARIKVFAEGKAAVKPDHVIFEKMKLLGKSEQEALEYFKEFREIESVEIRFRPSWLRRVPRFEERIEIQIL